jgi:murein DD-endopeptidase MepM/ murein hydrolase activator NlpD
MNWFLKSVPRLIALSLLLGLLPATAPVGAQTSGPTYIVQSGDTFFGIAQQFGITQEVLHLANPTVDPALLSIGQALNIPGFEGVTGTLGAHPLEPGETLDSVALRLGFQRETLIHLNHLVNPDLLYINEPIIIVDQLDGGAAIPHGIMYPRRAGQGLLSLAAALNQNPWTLAEVNRLPNPGLAPAWLGLVAPGGDLPVKALPFPVQDIQIHPLPPDRGRTVSIHLQMQQPVTVTGTLGEWPLHFNVENENSQYALLGINRLTNPDLYRLTISVTGAAGDRAQFSQTLPVREGHYSSDPMLIVDPATIDPAVTVPELEKIKAITAPFTPTRYWKDIFVVPSVGGLRSVYGSLRAYNGGPYDSFHTGADFSGAEDRPVTAPAPGVVVFTGELTVRGNATIIDHGWGVYTGYWHQSVIQVKVGDQVETGQQIGFQGATGRVTGPHLHWELWVGGFQVDPLQWTTEAFP